SPPSVRVRLPLWLPEPRLAGPSLVPPAVPMRKPCRSRRPSSGFVARPRLTAPGAAPAPAARLPAPAVGPCEGRNGTRPFRRTASLVRPDYRTPLRQKTDCLRSPRTPRALATVAAAAPRAPPASAPLRLPANVAATYACRAFAASGTPASWRTAARPLSPRRG